MGQQVVNGTRNGIRFLYEESFLLLVGAVVALVWANSHMHSYHEWIHQLHFIVNDVIFLAFFTLAGVEIRKMFAHELKEKSARLMAITAMLGGVLGPALVYIVLTSILSPELRGGWPASTATDIAFSYVIARICFRTSPANVRQAAISLLLVIAVMDDMMGIGLLTALYSQIELVGLFLGGVLLALTLCVARFFQKAGVQNHLVYVLLFIPSWVAFYVMGVHPALASLPVIFFIPINGEGEMFEDIRDPAKAKSPLGRLEESLKFPSEFALLLFGLVNCGIAFSNTGEGTLVLTTSLLLGKTFGIFSAVLVGLRLGLRLPDKLELKHILVLGSAASAGGAVSIVFITQAFAAGALQDSMKIGALLSVVAAAATAAVVSRLLLREHQPKPIEVDDAVYVFADD